MSVLPLYHRVFLSLRDQIVNGICDWQKPLPSESQLSVEYGVSRATIRKALDLLEEEGLVTRRQGARTYPKMVGYKNVKQRRNLDLLAREKNHLELLPGEIEQHYEVIKTDKELARQFNKLDALGRVVRIRLSQGKPYCFVVTYMPLEIANRIDWAQLGSKPVITAAVEIGYDFRKVEQSITATVADEESAIAMKAPIGSPLLRMSGLFIDANDNAMMRKDGYFHPDSFEYRMTLYNKNPSTSDSTD
jgi:GntR family transcriptional regulator